MSKKDKNEEDNEESSRWKYKSKHLHRSLEPWQSYLKPVERIFCKLVLLYLRYRTLNRSKFPERNKDY